MKTLLKYIKISAVIAICVHIIHRMLSYENIHFTWYGELKTLSIQLLFAFPITIALGEFHNFISKYYPWKKNYKKRLWISAIGSVIIAMVVITIVRFIIRVFIFNVSITNYWELEKYTYYLTSLVITIFITVLFHAFYFFKELQKEKITEQKIIAGNASAKFDALKNQLDPHFLFNSLNVLTALIEEDSELAQKFTTSLSKVYRYVLEQKNKELVTVNEELDFAKTYMTLLKLRFEDSIIFNMPKKISNPEAKIIPLSLQILLENTVKHNIVTTKKPLEIKIYEKEHFLIVENNLQPKQIIKKSTGVGLSNVMQRYALVTQRAFTVHKTNNTFVAKLPLLYKQIKKNNTMISKNEINESKYKDAQKRVENLRGFYNNLFTYIIVITGLSVLNYQQNEWRYPWFLWPAFGWGLGIFFHALKTYQINPIFNKDWEERKIRKYMEEENGNKQMWQ